MRKSPPRPKKKNRPAATIDVRKQQEVKKDEPDEKSAEAFLYDIWLVNQLECPTTRSKSKSESSKPLRHQKTRNLAERAKTLHLTSKATPKVRVTDPVMGSGGKPPARPVPLETPAPSGGGKSGGGGFILASARVRAWRCSGHFWPDLCS